MRNDARSLAGVFDRNDEAAVEAELARHYDAVEHEVGAAPGRRFQEPGPLDIAEVNVLPGRRRNLALHALDASASNPNLVVHCGASIGALEHRDDGSVETIEVRREDGVRELLKPRHVVLAMGVIDSNLFALERLATRPGIHGDRIAGRLHDHWSVPVATLRFRRGRGLERLYPPAFVGSLVQGRRAEFHVSPPSGDRCGFLHIQAQYDAVEPYATLKACMNARQAGESWASLVRRILPLAKYSGRMARIGYARYVERRLFVPEGLELTAVMDFESHDSPSNRLAVEHGAHRMYWDVRDEDVEAFARLAPLGRAALTRVASDAGFELTWQAGDGASAWSEHLRRHAIDAYHLGGGLAVGRDRTRGVVDPGLRFYGVPNLAVIGTAAFARPGIANPVETILASAERYVASL
jgi:choline dehydrogenase-like flavoprotein